MQDSDIELLTALVDGELSRSQQKAVLRLLHGSSEARGLLWHLQENAHALKQLPAHTLPADFAGKVMEAIRQAPAPSQPAAKSAPRPLRYAPKIAMRLAWAAGIILAVAGSGLLYWFVSHDDIQPQQELVQSPENFKEKDKDDLPPDLPPTPQKDPKSHPSKHKPHVDGAHFAFTALKEKRQQKQFAEQLGKNKEGTRLDVPVHDLKAIRGIANAFQKKGITVIFDKTVAASLKNQDDVQYTMFIENTPADEIAGVLGKVGADQGVDGLYASVMSAEDRKVLCAALKIPEDQFLKPREEPGFDLNPIVKEKGEEPKKSSNPTPSVVSPSPTAIVLVEEKVGGGKRSDQIQRFVGQRRALRPSTVQVMLVLTPVSE
jgi:hypothetical protein